MTNIKLKDIFNIPENEYYKYKVHFACQHKDGKEWSDDPFDLFLSNKNEWLNWNQNSGHKNAKRDFTREYIISFVWHDNAWLFTGIFKTIGKRMENSEYTNIKKEFVGKLKIIFPTKKRTTYYNLETCWDNLILKEILDKPIEFKNFDNYKNVHLSFYELMVIVKNNYQIWYEKLSQIKGIYLIYDKCDKKVYIGSASGKSGIWQRWRDYVYTEGTGNNKLLKEMLEKNGKDYMEKNLEFTLLEYFFEDQSDDKYILSRETYWKNILHARDEETGLCDN
ncbi:MAG TPA: GIY-YIG nuclease family protein [Rickettsiales bacterium]|nr:GIY-YIG nuclease family protein [Rickettsiales bacterium]